MESKLKSLLNRMIEKEGSDLHLKSGGFPRVRVNGLLEIAESTPMSEKVVTAIAKTIMTQEQYDTLLDRKSIDFIYLLDGINRFRVNFFFQMDGLSAVFRQIPATLPTIESLELPETIKSFTTLPRGLVLVTGVTGSGKSTTLAAMLNEINLTSSKHIITIEDPIEFVHQDKNCLINQRAIGQDTHSFSDALRAALREDPDIILVGEMRDLETIDIALHAANTGHLVFSTVHTLDAKETVDRIIGMFSHEEQNRIRNTLASVLEGVISQRLVPTKDGGRTVAVEVLKKTARIEQLIREDRDYEIPDALLEGKEIYGTQTFDQSLLALLNTQKITQATALEYATNPSDMKLKMEGIGKGALKSEKVWNRSSEIFGFKEEERV